MNGRPGTLTSITTVRGLLHSAGVRPARGLGQNFLVDANVLGIIEEAARLSPADTVIEVGAGLGAVTRMLLDRCRELVAVEWDGRLAGVLEDEFGGEPNFALIEANATRFDPSPVKAERGWETAKVVSNLPYGIAATLVIDWLERYPWITEYTVMVQREVADRLTAAPGGGEYSAASVKVRYRARVERVATVSRNCFYPKPRVDSTLLRLERYGPEGKAKREGTSAEDECFFSRLVGAAFSQRRKKLANSLAADPGLDLDRERIYSTFAELGIDPTVRAERVSIEEFVLLSNALRP